MIPVIVGPTGSGKTGVAVQIAKVINGEIISADSRTVYRGMDIGTAKPTEEEREGVRHFGFDLVEPGDRFTVKDWKDYAERKIVEIKERGSIPMVVGGTGLYIDALVFNYRFEVEGKAYDRNRGVCTKNLNEEYPDRKEIDSEYKIFGILWTPEELKERLRIRANKMFNDKLFSETERLVKKYGWNNKAMTSDIYEYAWRCMQGEFTRDEAVRLTATKDWQLAKRQMTWFKRNKSITWLPLDKIKDAVIKCIQNE